MYDNFLLTIIDTVNGQGENFYHEFVNKKLIIIQNT